MTNEKAYFIKLLNSYVNGTVPAPEAVDWNEIFRLSEIHDVQAIIANQISLLPSGSQPDYQLNLPFRQCVGRAVQSSIKRDNAVNIISQIFDDNDVDYIFVKGTVLKKYYPTPEFRTSGDIDIIIRESDYQRMVSLLKNRFEDLIFKCDTSSFKIDGVIIEIHKDADVLTHYFDDIFDLAKNRSNQYDLDLYDNLYYVICHLLKHIKFTGAGIRMLLDIDLLIRSIPDFDLNRVFNFGEENGIFSSVQYILSLSKLWLDTPIDSDLLIDFKSEVLDLFERIMIDGGSFGNELGGLGTLYLSQNSDGKINFANRSKAFFKLLFPDVDYVRKYYNYSVEHPALIPVAYLNRGFEAIFKRNRHTRDTVSQIFTDNDISLVQYKLLKELEL